MYRVQVGCFEAKREPRCARLFSVCPERAAYVFSSVLAIAYGISTPSQYLLHFTNINLPTFAGLQACYSPTHRLLGMETGRPSDAWHRRHCGPVQLRSAPGGQAAARAALSLRSSFQPGLSPATQYLSSLQQSPDPACMHACSMWAHTFSFVFFILLCCSVRLASTSQRKHQYC